jgi:hypothetical protein
MLRDRAIHTPPSLRFRIVVSLSVLLVLFTSVAQAVHHHGSLTGSANVRALSDIRNFAATDTVDSDPTCPLCAVSHSALPSFPTLIRRLVFSATLVSFLFQSTEPRGFWSYNLFCRPPPQA